MQATIIAVGSRGDVQPHVALGKGLKDAGHTVRVLTSGDFRELVVAYGLDFFDSGGSMEAVAREMQHLLEEGNFLKIMSSMGKSAEQLGLQVARAGLAACDGSDVIIAGLGGLSTGIALSEKLGIPFVPAYLYPFSPTREFPGILTPVPQTPLTAWANGLSHRLSQQIIWQTTRRADNLARAEVLGVPAGPFWGPFATQQRDRRPILYGYSAHVLPVPRDWESFAHVTGYWFLDAPAGWTPPADLTEFLDAGSPPVYLGFGSMVSTKPEETTELALQALARTGQRGVLSAGWGGLAKTDLPQSVFMVGSAPHAWLFPRMAAVVHHGGAGTTAAGLRAGAPSVITPFMGDQAFWGRRVEALGVGPAPVPRKRLTAESLTAAIQLAVSDAGMRERARALGERIRAEDGVARAVEVIESSVGG